MYIPRRAIIIVVICIIIYVHKTKKGDGLSAKRMWKEGNRIKKEILLKKEGFEIDLEREIKMVYEIEKDLILLNGYYKYKKDKIRIKEVAEKWMKYVQAVKEIKMIEEESLERKHSIETNPIYTKEELKMIIKETSKQAKDKREKTTTEIRKRAKDELDNRTISGVIY